LIVAADGGGGYGMSSTSSQRPNKAECYVIKDIWVDDGVSEKDVVIEVQGVRGDGSYWVTGLQVRIPKSSFDSMKPQEILSLIWSKVAENERELDSAYVKALENEALTDVLKKDSKVGGLVGVRIDYKQIDREKV
jgi:hypothetical protein